MKISELIDWLEKVKHEKGDLELYGEDSDGRCTWTAPFKPRIVRRQVDRPWGRHQTRCFLGHDGY